MLGIGPPFRYVITSFDVISVELKPIRIHGATPQGEEHIYDGFIRNDPSLSHSLPAWMTVMDSTVVDVSLFPGRGAETMNSYHWEGLILEKDSPKST